MGINKPYRRTVRIFTDDTYGKYGKWEYILHDKYAESPANFVRAFLLIQEDLVKIFNYIEPSDINLKTYSHRIHELLLRTCVEVEANCKAILKENDYEKIKNWNVEDYKKIEQSHFLSQFEISIPNWRGENNIRRPFKAWGSSTETLVWYQAYNHIKHDRHQNFQKANFENLIDAVAGLAVLIASQFYTYSFDSGSTYLTLHNTRKKDDFESSIGDLFRIKYPKNIKDCEKYDFSCEEIDFDKDIFQKFNYK